jgi:hypothetical protein
MEICGSLKKSMNTNNKETVRNFIDEIWNQNLFEKFDNYLHPEFTDLSLPPSLPATNEGLKLWIIGTGKSFKHETIIEEMVCEDDKVIVKIKMLLKHIGTWRNIEPTGKDIHATGYRYFSISNKKIIRHEALIDGNSIEKQLQETHQGCKIQ